MHSSLSGGGGGDKKKRGLLHLEINQLAMNASNFGSVPRQFGNGLNLGTSPRPFMKKSQTQLPSIGLGPLHIKLAQPTSTAAPAEKGASSPLVFSEENTHSFIQNTWSTFSNLSDSHRNQLLKGLLSRSSSQQIEFICTCLNIKSLDNGTPGNPVPTKVFPETVLGKYLVNSRRKPENYHLKTEVAAAIRKAKNEETFKEAMKRTFGNEEPSPLEDTTDFMSSSDNGSYLNSNTYVKLMNINMSPDSLSKQIASASPEGIRFLTTFLSKQCDRFQKILRAMDVISKQAELEMSAEKFFDLMLDVTDAQYATIYFSTTPGSPVKVHNNNWPYARSTVNEDQIFASDSVFKGDMINAYNFEASDYYKASQSSHYHSVKPSCILSAPFYGDGLRVTGILELIGKRTGNPLFTVEEEFIVQSLASMATILFNQLAIKQASTKKNDNLKAFLETTNAMPVTKIEMGDLVDVIMSSARELVNADRCTLFLYDENTDELWSKLAHGSEPIRIPSDLGLAGHVFQTGKLVNTQDAYADSRFNQIIDKSTGYKTETILSVPMINQDNEVIGVMQAINKLPLGFVFNDDDIVQLQTFATLATSTLQKSNQIYELTQLVHEQRFAIHYYQCMLQTGNDVLITIGSDSRASSIENAHLLGYENLKSLMRTTSFEHWLGRQNYKISDAISSVKSTSKPISVHYHVFYKPDRTPMMCSYYVRRINNSTHDDSERGMLPSSSKSAPKRSATKKGPKARRQSIVEQTLETVDTSSAPFGILLVISPIVPNRIMIDQLACQLDQSIITDFLLEPSKLEGEQQPITNFAVNIRRFSSLIKLLPPNKVNLLLNRYFEMLTTIANQYNGALVDTNGSFAQITFGIPYPNPDDASKAVDCALSVQKALKDLNRKTEDVGLPTIHLSIGLSSGIGMCGAVGPSKMKKYTVMGNPVDDSIDMQWIANTYGANVLVDINTKELIKDSYHLREVDLITYGQHSNLTLFEIMASTEDDTDHDILTTIISYELGLAEYRSKNWQAAIMHFKKSQTLTDDHPSKYMIERCRGLIDGKYEVNEGWDGGWTLGKEK